jgi:hypothetical protein
VLAVDPSRRRGGGALLGDRIRMNALDGGHVFFRSLATRGAPEPFYINGPRDDTYGNLAKLRRRVGDGNFDYLVQFPGPAY